MKKFNGFVALFAALLFSSTLSAQTIRIKESSGYGIGISGTQLGTKSTNDGTKNLYGSLGGGIPLSINTTMMFNEKIGADLGFTYLFGRRQKINVYDNSTSTGEEIAYTRQARLSPSFVLATGEEDLGFDLYTRLGVIIPISSKTFLESDITTSGVASKIESKNWNKMALGYVAAAGVIYPFSDNFAVFGEVEFNALSSRMHKGEYSINTSGGTDNLTSGSVAASYKYVDEVPTAGLDPDTKSATKINYNAIFIKVGMSINFDLGGGYTTELPTSTEEL